MLTGARQPKINFLVHDLSGNPIVRAASLIRALQSDFEVDVHGLAFRDQIYAPYRDAFTFKAVHVAPSSGIRMARRLARSLDGDLLVACKPLPSTLLPAMIGRRGRPVLLDVEDDEWRSRSVDAPAPGLRGLAQRAFDLRGGLIARLSHPLVAGVRAVTVGSRVLQRRYGGTIIRHGPAQSLFDPARRDLADAAAQRRRFGLPVNRRLALFAGVPRPHKGWDVLLQALGCAAASGWDLVAAGNRNTNCHDRAREVLGERFHKLSPVPNDEMPLLLRAVDAVPVPQRPVPYAIAQIPAKALEAMAASVPVIATAVGDLPEIFGSGRGWLIAPDHPEQLAAALLEIENSPEEVGRRTAEARNWYLAEASDGAIRARLLPLVERLLKGARGSSNR
jgi:glycosyltransferase involved in cell wall biosynthesis